MLARETTTSAMRYRLALHPWGVLFACPGSCETVIHGLMWRVERDAPAQWESVSGGDGGDNECVCGAALAARETPPHPARSEGPPVRGSEGSPMPVLVLNTSLQPLSVIHERRLVVLLSKQKVAFVDEQRAPPDRGGH